MANDETPTVGGFISYPPPFPCFDCETDSQTIGLRWKKYVSKFENFIEAASITDERKKRALFLHYVGDNVVDIYKTLDDSDHTYKSTSEALGKYFMPIQNLELEMYKFRQIKQHEYEPLEQYHTRLRRAAAMCAFSNIDREVKSQIISGCKSSKLRKHALKTPTLSLNDLLNHGKAEEASEKHNAEFEALEKQNVNWLNTKQQGQHKSKQNKPTTEKSRQTQYKSNKQRDTCLNCGCPWHLEGLKTCKARGQTCRACGKIGHYAKVCMSKQTTQKTFNNDNTTPNKEKTHTVAHLENKEETTKPAFIFVNMTKETQNTTGLITLNILNTPITFIIDSGATVNIISKQDWDKIRNKPKLHPPNRTVFAYGQNKPLDLMGKINSQITHKGKIYHISLFICESPGPTILSKDTSMQMNLIQFIDAITETSADKSSNHSNLENYITARYPELFKGVGKHYTAQIKLHIDKSVIPTTCKHRRIPFHLREPVEMELNKLESDDIIERIPEATPTPWISPIVVVPKKNQKNIRICIDMREANLAVRRERHVTPTIDDILYDLNGATCFSKLDLRQGYHQYELEPESRHITTFATHAGLYRYKRLNFGISAAAEIFQNEVAKLLRDIPNTINVSDDILIYGRTQQQHDKALYATLTKLSSVGLTLNGEKCLYNKQNLNFFGHTFNKEGMTADPNKILAIQQARLPQSPTEVRSLLGMFNFCARYLPNLATLSQPLRELTHKDTTWQWKPEHQQAYDSITRQLATNTKLSYFDKTLPTEIWTDASPVGVAAILAQRKGEQPSIIAFASRTLTDTETRYSQIEREALAITWAIQHFTLYIYGAEFQVVTDHKPLVYLFNNPRAKLSARMERWRLKLQPYIFTVIYRDGKLNPADYLSRHPPETGQTSYIGTLADEYINFLATHTAPKAINLDEIRKHTTNDNTLQHIMGCLRTGKWHEEGGPGVNKGQVTIMKKLQQELTIAEDDSLLLRGTKIVIPISLQNRTIEVAHTGHQGEVKTKQLLREKVWFAGIDQKVHDKIKNCLPCNAATNTYYRMPLQTSELPEHPWETLHLDHKGPLPSGEYLLVALDLYSRFPVVEVVKSTSLTTNIGKLDDLFAVFGIPKIICTDNGPPFNSTDFSRFLAKHGTKHRKITPVWPQANGEVERFNRTLNKILQIANSTGSNWRMTLNKMLRSYRATPHTATGIAPAELLYNRPMNIGIPTIPTLANSPTISREQLEMADSKAKVASKNYFDKHYTMLKTTPKIGDQVLIKQRQKNKLTTPFDINPYEVIDVKGSMITSQRMGQTLTRNASQLKIIPKPPDVQSDRDKTSGKETTTQEHPEDTERGLQPEANDTIDNGTPPPPRYGLREKTTPPRRLIEEI